jgi:iron complex outermembrane receptor protein
VKKFTTAYRTQPVARRVPFAVTSTATGCAILMLSAGHAAYAADAVPAASAEAPLEEIVVTGIRKGIEDSIAAKKNSSSIVEVVSSEDIGKLPDASIAESIARLPGIAAQRTAGRAQTLSIRGLGPDYTVTTFNGREQPSTNDNRSVEFDQYPSELVSQVKIYKTPDAGMTYQGIAGTADIGTVKPLAFGQRVRSVTYKREQDGQKSNIPSLSDAGNRASATYIDQFLDHTLGVAMGVAYNKTPYQAQTREPWGYADGPGGTKIIGGSKDGIQSSYFQRLGWLGVVEFKPNDQLHMVFDGYHSNFKELQTIRRMEYGLQWGGGSLTSQGPTVGNRIVSGTYSNIPFVVAENYSNETHAKVDAFGLNTDLKLNDDWTLNGDLSYSQAHRTRLRLESTAGTGTLNAGSPIAPTPETATFTTNGDGVTIPTITGDYSNYNTTFLTDPGGWGSSPRRAGFWDDPTVDDKIKAVKLAAERKLTSNVVSKISFGLNYAEREKDKYRRQGNLYLPNGTLYTGVVPEAYRNGVLSTAFFGNPNGMINYDALGLFHSGYFNVTDARIDPSANLGDRIADVTGSWQVKEKLTTAYVKLDIDTTVGDVPLTGNIGVQAQRTDQTSYLGLSSSTDSTVAVIEQQNYVAGAKYTDVLPSLNLSFAFEHDIKLRLAAATTVARPRMDDLAGGASFSVTPDSGNPAVFQGKQYYWTRNGGGNPKLEPWKANAYDISLEKYFSNKGYVSASVYYKDLTSYVFQKQQIVDFTGIAVPDATLYSAADGNRAGVAQTLINGHGGSLRGLELSVSLPGDALAQALNGFGLIVSGAWNRSSINPTGTKETPLPGLSPRVINSTVYYEKYGFSARISHRYRGAFYGEVPKFDGALDAKNVKSESLLDAQVGYEFKEGALKGLSLNLSGTNLTDAPFVQYNPGDPDTYVQKYEKYGAVYTAAVSYKF